MPAASETDPPSQTTTDWSRVGAVLVTWNAVDHVGAALRALPERMRVVIVDNASSDGTAELVERLAPHAEVVRNPTNSGFAAGVNEGLRRMPECEYVLLLNPDASIEASGVAALVAHCDLHPDVGLASAAIVDAAGVRERSAGGREPSLVSVAVHELGLGRWLPRWSLYNASMPVEVEARDWVAGTCVLVRRRAIDAVGELDESFFLYAEDIDWCRRMRAHGWRVVVVPESRATHKRSTSVRRAGAWVHAHRMGSLDRYYARHHGRLHVVAFRLLRSAGSGGRALAFTIASPFRPALRARARERWSDALRALRPGGQA